MSQYTKGPDCNIHVAALAISYVHLENIWYTRPTEEP
jgi:hypothetical protein